MNTADETEILKYLNCYPRQFVTGKEVCRRAGGRRRYERDPRWAMPILDRLADRGLLEVDSDRRYRVVVEEAEAQSSTSGTSSQTDGGPQKIYEINEEELRRLEAEEQDITKKNRREDDDPDGR